MDEKWTKSSDAVGNDPFEDMSETEGENPKYSAHYPKRADAAEEPTLSLESKETAGAATKPSIDIEDTNDAAASPPIERLPSEESVMSESLAEHFDEEKGKPFSDGVADLALDQDPETDLVREHGGNGNQLLDDLIEIIDKEVEEVFGSGAMTDPQSAENISASEKEQHVIFTLADTDYAIPISNLMEIGRPLRVTPVPNTPGWLVGVANLRGDVISMVDLKAFLGLASDGYMHSSVMLVAETPEGDVTTSLIVDKVEGIHDLIPEGISDPTAPIDDQVAPYLRGVYEHDGRLLVVLDFERLLNSSEMRQFDPV